jgi:hypothetical protein
MMTGTLFYHHELFIISSHLLTMAHRVPLRTPWPTEAPNVPVLVGPRCRPVGCGALPHPSPVAACEAIGGHGAIPQEMLRKMVSKR